MPVSHYMTTIVKSAEHFGNCGLLNVFTKALLKLKQHLLIFVLLRVGH